MTPTSTKQADFKCNLLAQTYLGSLTQPDAAPPLLKNQQKEVHSDHGWRQPGLKHQEAVQKPRAAKTPEVPDTKEKVPEERHRHATSAP